MTLSIHYDRKTLLLIIQHLSLFYSTVICLAATKQWQQNTVNNTLDNNQALLLLAPQLFFTFMKMLASKKILKDQIQRAVEQQRWQSIPAVLYEIRCIGHNTAWFIADAALAMQLTVDASCDHDILNLSFKLFLLTVSLSAMFLYPQRATNTTRPTSRARPSTHDDPRNDIESLRSLHAKASAVLLDREHDLNRIIGQECPISKETVAHRDRVDCVTQNGRYYLYKDSQSVRSFLRENGTNPITNQHFLPHSFSVFSLKKPHPSFGTPPPLSKEAYRKLITELKQNAANLKEEQYRTYLPGNE